MDGRVLLIPFSLLVLLLKSVLFQALTEWQRIMDSCLSHYNLQSLNEAGFNFAFDSKTVLFQIITEWYYVLALLLLMAVNPSRAIHQPVSPIHKA